MACCSTPSRRRGPSRRLPSLGSGRHWFFLRFLDCERIRYENSACKQSLAIFPITPAARDAWLRHMRVAVDELELPEQLDKMLWDYLVMAANSMINQLPQI